MISVLEQKIENYKYCTIRWMCSTKGVLYFQVYRGFNPEDKELIAVTYNVSLNNISLNTPKLKGSIYMYIEALNGAKEVTDSLSFRITSEYIGNYLKYRKWFESNFLKAAQRSAAGTNVVILQRKFSGIPCTKCANPVSGEPGNPSCPECYGTGYQGGFYTPIITPALRGAKQEVEGERGSAAPVRRILQNFILPPYPVLQFRDYIVDLADKSVYEIIPGSSQTMEMDHQRLGSTMYTAEELKKNHPITLFPVVEVLPAITGITFVDDKTICITGTKLRPTYGLVYLVLENKEQTDIYVVDEDIYYFESIKTVLDNKIEFTIDDRFFGKYCTYRVVINNIYFEGELNAPEEE